jgi:hypothetical protein
MFLSACEKKDSSVIDSLGSPPIIFSATISPSIVNLDTIPQTAASIQFVASARITHQEGSTQISEVNYSISDKPGFESLGAGQLFDNGIVPDKIAGDSVFSVMISISTQSLLVGRYFCQIVAQDPRGFKSNGFILPIDVGRQLNHSPGLSDLQTPDTIVLAGQRQQFKLTVKATDPDGQSDIARVFFNSFKPNGSPAGGNPFLMYDDGSESIVFPPDLASGDAVKGDGTYTLTVLIDPTDSQGNPTALGTYRFEFQAADRSNALSQKLTKNIQVAQ